MDCKCPQFSQELRSIKGIAFDGFDTLVKINSEKRVFQQLCKTAGISFSKLKMTESITLRQFSNSIGITDINLLEELEDDLKEEVSSITPFEDSLLVLRELKRQGYILALASNATGKHAERLSDLFRSFVDVLHISCEVGSAKPSPEFFSALCRRMNLYPENILMIGDNVEFDIKPAIDHGMIAIQIIRNNTSNSDQYGYGQCCKINSLNVILDSIRELITN